jgi:membrane-anchored protein YejM (alkaline phosphatase superfamily)
MYYILYPMYYTLYPMHYTPYQLVCTIHYHTLHRYYTAVTHMDWHFGMVLKALEDSGQAQDTIVSMTGDHGWQV